MGFKLGSETRGIKSSKDTPIFRKKLEKEKKAADIEKEKKAADFKKMLEKEACKTANCSDYIGV